MNLLPPTFGLNFLNDKKSKNKDFMLLCGFENFDDFMLDRYSRKVILINIQLKDEKEIKVIPEMLNLLGCSKENFAKLIKKMNYKIYEKEKEFFIKYLQTKKRMAKKQDKKDYSNNPFNVLNQLNLK